MPKRLLSLLAVLAVVLVAGAGCAEDVSPALRVQGLSFSDADILDEVDEWANNPQVLPEAEREALVPGTLPMTLVNGIIQQRIDFELHNVKFAELGLVLDDEARQQALLFLFNGDDARAQEGLSGFSDDYASEYVDNLSRQLAVQTVLPEQDYLAWQRAAYAEADIEVSPRYGRWDAEQGSVAPPDGPTSPEPEPLAL